VLLSLPNADALSIHCTENFKTNIPRNETARPRPQFLHSCICERFIYSHDRSTNAIQQIGGPIVGIYKSFTDTVHECRSWEHGHAVSFLGLFVSNFRYSLIYTKHFSIHKRGIINHQSSKKGLQSSTCKTRWAL
jgi:hypothetical protein